MRLESNAELDACLAWLLDRLHREGVPLADVQENHSWSQGWFFPRLSADGAEYLTYVHDTDERPDVAAIMDWYAERHEPPEKGDRTGYQADTPWVVQR